MKKIVALNAFVCLAIACAVTPAPRVIKNTFPVERPIDAVWQSTVEAFADLNLSIETINKDSFLIASKAVTVPKEYSDCGSQGAGDVRSDYRAQFNVFLKKTGESSTEMKVNAIFDRIVFYDLPAGPRTYTCVSTGKLEATFYETIKAKLGIK